MEFKKGDVYTWYYEDRCNRIRVIKETPINPYYDYVVRAYVGIYKVGEGYFTKKKLEQLIEKVGALKTK